MPLLGLHKSMCHGIVIDGIGPPTAIPPLSDAYRIKYMGDHTYFF